MSGSASARLMVKTIQPSTQRLDSPQRAGYHTPRRVDGYLSPRKQAGASVSRPGTTLKTPRTAKGPTPALGDILPPKTTRGGLGSRGGARGGVGGGTVLHQTSVSFSPYIASTPDVGPEKSYLHRRTFVQLRNEAASHGLVMSPVDVDSEEAELAAANPGYAAEPAAVIDAKLAAIDACASFFVCVIGQSYGKCGDSGTCTRPARAYAGLAFRVSAHLAAAHRF